MSSGTELSTALLDWHPHASPRSFHQLLQGWVKSRSLRSSLSPPFQVIALGGPTALQPLALCPIWFWNRGRPFQSRLFLLSEKVLRTRMPFLSDLSPHFLSLVYPSYFAPLGNSQFHTSKSTPLGCLLWNLKALDFQGGIRPKRLIYYSNTVCPQYRLDNRSHLPGKSHGRRSLVGCSPWGRYESDTTEWLRFHFSLPCIGEGNGNPLPCSCLENPRDGGAWWAAVYGVTQSRTWLKRLSSSSIQKTELSIIILYGTSETSATAVSSG